MDEKPPATAPEYKSKSKEFFARFLRTAVNGALAYGAWKLSNDPRFAVLAPLVTGPLGKALRIALPAEHGWKVPF